MITPILNKPSRALVVFSGGQDSTTCLFWAKKHFTEVYALSFVYGQKHVREVELARQIAEEAGVHFDVMDVSFISQLAHNSLTDTSIPMDSEKPADGVPNTFCAGTQPILSEHCGSVCTRTWHQALGYRGFANGLFGLPRLSRFVYQIAQRHTEPWLWTIVL